MKFCARCGSKNTDETAVCTVCGLPFAGTAPMTEPKKAGRAFSVIVILLAVLSIALAAVIMILSMPKAEAPVMEVPAAIPTAEVTPTPEVTPEPEPEPEPTQVPATPEPTPTPAVEDYGNGFTPVSRAWIGVRVTVIGAEFVVDQDGNDAIRIFYNLKNTGDEAAYLSQLIGFFEVKQDGEYGNLTHLQYDDRILEDHNRELCVRPGATIRCAQEYLADPNGGMIYVTVNPIDSGTPVITHFNPENMPGRPAFDFVPEPVPDPQWLIDAPDRGTADGIYDVYIDNAQVFTGENGKRQITIFMEFTNNSTQVVSADHLNLRIYQDGVGLYCDEDTEEELKRYDALDPGESIRFAMTMELYSENPVEVEIMNADGTCAAGCVFDIPAA